MPSQQFALGPLARSLEALKAHEHYPVRTIGAPPEMLTTSSAEWRDDVAALHALVDRVGQKDSSEKWGTHPVFGQVSGEEWGLLCWRHLDYHLRQFGV